MELSKIISRNLNLLMLLQVLLFLLPLTGCQTIITTDANNQCDHPAKPSPPITDGKAALYIIQQGEAIDKCRVLLGHK